MQHSAIKLTQVCNIYCKYSVIQNVEGILWRISDARNSDFDTSLYENIWPS